MKELKILGVIVIGAIIYYATKKEKQKRLRKVEVIEDRGFEIVVNEEDNQPQQTQSY